MSKSSSWFRRFADKVSKNYPEPEKPTESWLEVPPCTSQGGPGTIVLLVSCRHHGFLHPVDITPSWSLKNLKHAINLFNQDAVDQAALGQDTSDQDDVDEVLNYDL